MRRVAYPVASIALAVLLAGCGLSFFNLAPREAWRDEAERDCLRSGILGQVALTERANISEPGSCGMERPLKVSAVAEGQVMIAPAATLACPVIVAFNEWIEQVQGAAYARFGVPVVEIKNIASYGCRTMNNQSGAKISEHAFGNAVDVAGFRFADGREILVKSGWRGRPDEQAFLREIFAAACDRFSTVLGPGSDAYHHDHFHVDLARRSSGKSYCSPRPSVPAPNYPNYRDMRIAGAPNAAPGGYGAYPQPGYTQGYPQPGYQQPGYQQPPYQPGGWPARVTGSIGRDEPRAIPRGPVPPVGVPMGYAPVN